jgi:hypothetical protein
MSQDHMHTLSGNVDGQGARYSKILIFTCCYNERQNIGLLLDQIAEVTPFADILVVDDNSPDGTWDIIQSKIEIYPQIHAVQRPNKLGIGSAHKYALFFAMRNGYETLITMDADFSHDPRMLPKLLAAHGKNTFVTGSRYCYGGSSDYTGYRNIISRTGNIAARLALGVKLRELTTYFRVFDVNSLRRLPLRHIKASGYSYGVQLIYYLKKASVELREVPIHFSDRSHGSSKIPKLQVLYSMLDLLRLALRRLCHFSDVNPDIFVDDVCQHCLDPALAMIARRSKLPFNLLQTKRFRLNDLPVYLCLRCGHRQVPSGLGCQKHETQKRPNTPGVYSRQGDDLIVLEKRCSC